MKKKILIITEYFYPSSRNDAYLVTKIAEAISESSDNVDVICTSILDPKQELNTISGEMHRIKSINSISSNIFIKVIKLILITIQLTLKSFITIKKEDKVFTVTNPVFFLPILILLKKIKGFNLTLLVFDIFPENLLATGVLKEKSFLYKNLLKIYNWAYKKVDRVIVIGRDMQDIIEKKTNNNVPILYIPNWCDTNSIKSSLKDKNSIIKKYNLENKIVFSFVGNFGLVQNIENILNATLEVQNDKFIFLFIGDGAMKTSILNFIDKFKCKNIIYAGKYPTEHQNEFLNACDVSIMSLDKKMYGLGVPSKTYYNMAAAKPLLFIGHAESEIAKLIKENDIGWTIETENSTKLANLFDFICESPEQFIPKGLNAREICLNQYSEKIILDRYKKLYE